MNDLISRQAAIDEIEERKNANGYCNEAVISELNRLEGYIMRLPSAQPVAKDTNVPTNDCISRQAAIDAIQQHRENVLGGYEYDEGVAFVYAAAHNHIIDVIKQLPSAQADLITKIQNGIKVTDADGVYSCGMRNGMRWCISLIDGKEPLYENCPSAQPETANIIVGKSRNGMTMWYQCDNCNEPVDENDLYCRGCGRRFEHGSDR